MESFSTSRSLHHRLILPPPSLTPVSSPPRLIEISAINHLSPFSSDYLISRRSTCTFLLLKPNYRFSTTRSPPHHAMIPLLLHHLPNHRPLHHRKEQNYFA
ncbi:hypothetical protein HA466_0252630 [Hirschfeldia incana]|nr:hypothetical protein HA466_0257550 [Hirschfeldia incana]KAJ0236987.1 hypothetical protein HA466_0252630 [Hirschfeldia incana]